jgi:hypothetical protein
MNLTPKNEKLLTDYEKSAQALKEELLTNKRLSKKQKDSLITQLNDMNTDIKKACDLLNTAEALIKKIKEE